MWAHEGIILNIRQKRAISEAQEGLSGPFQNGEVSRSPDGDNNNILVDVDLIYFTMFDEGR